MNNEPPEDADELPRIREDLDYLMALFQPHLAGPGTADPTAVPQRQAVGSPGPGLAHVWDTLTPGEARRAWQALTRWTDWLTHRYRLDTTIPTCWYRHDAIVDELDALHASWTTAYLGPRAEPAGATLWLETFDRALNRIRGWDRHGCAAGTHHDDAPPPISDGVDDNRDRDAFLRADDNARRRAQRDATR